MLSHLHLADKMKSHDQNKEQMPFGLYLSTIVLKVVSKAAFILILRRQNQRFETLIQNAVNSGYCSSSSEPERRLYDVI